MGLKADVKHAIKLIQPRKAIESDFIPGDSIRLLEGRA